MALLRGYLYVIADKGRQFAKIGAARDVISRFKGLQAACPLDLEVVDVYPCTYVRFREFKVYEQLGDLRLQNEWFRWDEARIKAAIERALAIPDGTIRPILEKLHLWSNPDPSEAKAKARGYPVKRTDTGEVFPTAQAAAEAVLGSKRLAKKIRRAVKDGVKCGPTFWAKAGGYNE
jgi:hypothetical protein